MMNKFEKEIKEALKTAGMDENLYDLIKVEKAEDIQGEVVKFKTLHDRNSVLTGSELLSALREQGFDVSVTGYVTRETDRVVKKAKEDWEKEQGQTQNNSADQSKDDKKIDESKKDEGNENDSDAMKKIDALTETVGQLVESISKRDKGDFIRSELEKKNLPESFSTMLEGYDSEDIPGAVKAIDEAITSRTSENVNKRIADGDLRNVTPNGVPGSGMDKEIADFAKGANEGSNGIGGALEESEKKGVV